MTTILKIKRLDPTVPLPSNGHPNDAAYDLYASHAVVVSPGERVQVSTGIAMEIPPEFMIFIWDKSGLSHKHGIKTLGGVIDAGFRGEVKVGLINLGDEPYIIEKHHKIAQMVLQRRELFQIEETDTLSESSRGERGFGSTGK